MNKRPEVTDEMVRAVVQEVAAELASDESEIEAITDGIVRQYRHPMDGYELAIQLIKYEGWDVTRDESETMDAIDSRVGSALREAEKQWFAACPMQPPFPIGTQLTCGEITGIYEYGPGRYLVKENGCTQEGRRLIIKFEDART